MASYDRRRRVAALNFLSNISLDGSHRDTKYSSLTLHGLSSLLQPSEDKEFGLNRHLEDIMVEGRSCTSSVVTRSLGSSVHRAIEDIDTVIPQQIQIIENNEIENVTNPFTEMKSASHIAINPSSSRPHSNAGSVCSEASVNNPSIALVNRQHVLCGRASRTSNKSRIVIVTALRASPFILYSLIRYDKNKGHTATSREQKLPSMNLTEAQALENSVNETGQDVSYGNFLHPSKLPQARAMSTEISATLQHLDVTMQNSDAASCEELPYSPNVLDDPELRSGRHRTLLTFSSYMISVIDYARPDDLKKELNEKFKDRFPHIQLTLSKLRSLKRDLKRIAHTKCGVDLWTVAQSYVYFEKIILKGLLTKAKRKQIASACLVLSAKLNDTKGPELSKLIQELEETFKIHRRDVFACEFTILVQLEFSLHIPDSDVYTHYQRLLTMS